MTDLNQLVGRLNVFPHQGLTKRKGQPLLGTNPQGHKERKPGEVFIGYFSAAEYERLLYGTKRMGKYKMDSTGCYFESIFNPVFVPASELRQRLGSRHIGQLPEEGRDRECAKGDTPR